MPETDAASIVAKIDTTTVEGWNLRALLLRLLDGDAWNEDILILDAMDAITRRGFAAYPLAGNEFGEGGLTPLGREVAERLRPVPWTAKAGAHGWWVSNFHRCIARGLEQADAERIAALLTQDDLRAAKTYRTMAP
jgi:hypothetical protein